MKAATAFWFKIIDSIVDFVEGDLLDFISPITFCYEQLHNIENNSLSMSGDHLLMENDIA